MNKKRFSLFVLTAFIFFMLGGLVTANLQAASSLAARLAGRILLQVESKGEAWYVDPVSLQRSYLGRGADCFDLMRTKGLGITDADLDQISLANTEIPANWKTYVNNTYGFEIKYPATFLMRENNEKFQSRLLSAPYEIKNGIFSVDFKNKEGAFSTYCGATATETENVIAVQISLLENNNNKLTINDLTKNCVNVSVGNNLQKDCFFYDKTLDGYKAADVRINGIGGNLPAIYTVKGDKIYLISLAYSCDMDYHTSEAILNQMLSTLHFLE